MKRKAVKLASNGHHTTTLYVDSKEADVILPFVLGDDVIDQFKDIKFLILENLRNREKYCKADVSDKAKNVFEMRITGKGFNARIYCIEQTVSKRRCVVMVELVEKKKTQQIPKNIKSRLETIGGYEYEL